MAAEAHSDQYLYIYIAFIKPARDRRRVVGVPPNGLPEMDTLHHLPNTTDEERASKGISETPPPSSERSPNTSIDRVGLGPRWGTILHDMVAERHMHCRVNKRGDRVRNQVVVAVMLLR